MRLTCFNSAGCAGGGCFGLRAIAVVTSCSSRRAATTGAEYAPAKVPLIDAAPASRGKVFGKQRKPCQERLDFGEVAGVDGDPQIAAAAPRLPLACSRVALLSAFKVAISNNRRDPE